MVTSSDAVVSALAAPAPRAVCPAAVSPAIVFALVKAGAAGAATFEPEFNEPGLTGSGDPALAPEASDAESVQEYEEATNAVNDATGTKTEVKVVVAVRIGDVSDEPITVYVTG